MNKIFLLIYFISIPFLAVFSQSNTRNASIIGTIVDATTKEALSGATIVVQSAEKGTTTDRNGQFIIHGLLPGVHTLKISFVGYQSSNKELSLSDGETRRITIELQGKIQSLSEITVTAKSEARQLREAAMPISVIQMSEIQGTVSDINDVLAKTAGVKLRNSGGVGSSSRISVRGLEGKRIGYFIDETPMNDNADFLDLNDIPIDMIERIEVYKGVVPAKFGGSAIGGAVNIVLKEYPPKYLDASYSIASFNTHKISTVGKLNKNGYEFGIGGFYTYSDNNYKMELPLEKGRFIIRDHDQYKKTTIGGGFKSRRWWFDEVVFEPAVTFTEKQIQGVEYNIQEAKNLADAYFLSSHAEKKDFFVPGLDFEFDAAYAYTVFKFQDKAMQRYRWDGTTYPAATAFGGEIGGMPSDAHNVKHVFVNKINLNYILNSWSSINFNSTLNFANGIPNDTLRDKALEKKTNFNSTMYSWVAGLNYETRFFSDKLLNSVSAKFYHYDMTTQTRKAFGHGDIEDINNVKSNWGASEALRYRFTSDLLLKASAAYDVRLPSDNELLGDGFLITPSGDLVPERNTSFNAGLMYEKNIGNNRRFSIEVNGFYMHLQNMIRYVGGLLQANYQNFGEMCTIGTDMEIKWDPTDFLYLYANATYQDLRDVRQYEAGSLLPNPTKGARMPNIPYLYANGGFELHQGNLFGGRGQNSRLLANCSFVEEYFYDFEQSIYQERRIPRAFTIDAGLEHSFNNQRIIIGVQGNNLTNAKVISEFNRPLPGRNFAVKIRYIMK